MADQIIIVGAGVSGLSAAEELQKAGKSYIVLEGRDRLGGRVHSVPDSGVHLEYGAAWFHDYHNNEVAHLAEQNGFKALFDDEHSVLYDSEGPLDQALVGKVSGEFEKFRTQASSSVLLNELADKFATTLDNNDEKRAALAVINSVQLGLGVPTQQISAHFTPPGGRDKAVQGGYQQVVTEVLAKDVDRSKIELNTEVTQIHQTENGVTVTTNNGKSYQGNAVIVTVPVAVFKNEVAPKFEPALNTKITSAVSKTGIAQVEKVYLTFPQIFWDNSIFKFVISDAESPALVWNFGAVHPGSSAGHTLAVLVTGEMAHKLKTVATEAVFDLVLPLLEVVAKSEIPKPSSISISQWIPNKLSSGSFSSTPHGVTREEIAQPFIDGDRRVLFAGEHATVEAAGLVQGAYASGKRAAKQALEL